MMQRVIDAYLDAFINWFTHQRESNASSTPGDWLAQQRKEVDNAVTVEVNKYMTAAIAGEAKEQTAADRRKEERLKRWRKIRQKVQEASARGRVVEQAFGQRPDLLLVVDEARALLSRTDANGISLFR